MSFLTGLGQVVNEQFGLGSSVTSLDAIDGSGRVVPFGLLGDFAAKIDQTAQRTYIEDGFVRNIAPRQREVLFQKPDLTVIIKKRMFSSLAENFDLEAMEENERLFIRASKKLFQNKCKVIAAYEKLSKIEALAMDAGNVNSFMFPAIMSGISALEGAGILDQLVDQTTRATLETLRQVFAFSEPSSTTNWSIDNNTAAMSDLGEGTGTIELTMVQGVSTKHSVKFGEGSANFSVEDPYKLLKITNADIDMAIKDSTNFFKNSFFGRFTQIETQKLIQSQRQELNANRAARGASGIDFILNPVTIVSKRVRAILQSGLVGNTDETNSPEIVFSFNPGLAGVGSDVTIDPVALTGKEGLNDEDQSLFKQIIKNLYLSLAYEYETRSEVVTFNQETNYVRRKMQLHFGGKSMIQPLDVVNIFITSKTMYDDSIVQGFNIQSRGLNFGSTLNNLVRNINNLSSRYGNTPNLYDEMEKASIAGPDFPTWLWRIYRNDFTRQGAGTCVFTGLVKNAVRNFSSNEGKYMLNVTCEDNSGYFNKSKINIKPALDVFNSNLYDPLTPYKISFDGASGDVLTDVQSGQFPTLLEENENILKSDSVRFHNGRFRGSQVDKLLYQSQDGELNFNNYRQVLNDPLGFVYRWKEGIGSLTKTEPAFQPQLLDQEFSPALTADPFAGQDVMNVLSLIVTGQPYNYNTFLKAAIDAGNGLSPKSSGASTYIESLTNQLNKRNAVWGNFIPFKKLVISKDADKFIRSGLAGDFTVKNDALQSLMNERASLMDQLAILNGGYSKNPQVASQDNLGQFKVSNVFKGDSQNIEAQISALDLKIAAAQQQFSTTITNLAESKPDGRITIIGDNIALEPSYSNAQTAQTDSQRNLDDEDFRRKINFLTQRRLWKVKANNNDNNLFIVDDQYDKNFDIQAFSKKIGNNFSIFNSEYSTLDSQISQVAQLLGLEVFADSQGHIQARPPLYNRVPSSVFYRMFRDKERNGFQVFPQFLESLLSNQIQSQVSSIEIIEDEIRIRVLAIGIVPYADIDPDKTIASFLRGSRGNLNQTTGNVDTTFSFVSDFRTGKVAGFDDAFRKLISQSQPDMNEDFMNNSLQAISQGFNNAASATRLFDSVSRLDALAKVNFDAAFAAQNTTRIDTISKRLQMEKGVDAPTLRTLFSNDRLNNVNFGLSQLDTLKIMNEISSFVSERQGLLKSVTNTLKNLTDGIQLNKQGTGATAALFPNLNNQQSIPTILQHMIEDETNDDFGPGSGQRFVIKDRQILSLKIEETAPPYNLVQVNGLFGEGRIDAPSTLGLSADGGNQITSAYAIDYDSWRMYGFRASNSIQAPFFSDPDTQCAPYAVYLLNLAKKNILTGTIELVGNEFYQAGDVVYIEDEDMLFYVTEVNHTFNYSGTFVTTLSLKYGHNPGEYIPTILDIVGKFLYKTKEYTNFYRSNRFGVSNGDIPIGTVIFDNTFDNPIINQLLSGNRGADNQKILTQILLSTTGALSPAVFTGKRPVLQLRIYTNSKVRGPNPDEALRLAAGYVSDWLANPQQITAGGSIISVDKRNEGIDIAPLDNVEIIVVDTAKDVDKTPSQSAWDSVRLVAKTLGISNDNTNINIASDIYAKQLDNVLYSHIIDAWLTFEDVPVSISTGPKTTGNQAAQTNAAALQQAAANFGQGTIKG